MKKNLHKKAFSIIELMVVIAIIAILTGIIMKNLMGSRSKARDAKRISDMSQIQLALELYYDRCKQYPVPNGTQVNIDASNCLTGTAVFSNYISKLPTPPTPTTQYDYGVDDVNAPTNYVLHVTLENTNEVQKDSYQGSDTYGYTCYNGSNYQYCLAPK